MIGIATTQEDADQYEEEGYKRIDRESAIYQLSVPCQNGQQLYIGVTVDGRPVEETRQMVARAIRKGERVSLKVSDDVSDESSFFSLASRHLPS